MEVDHGRLAHRLRGAIFVVVFVLDGEDVAKGEAHFSVRFFAGWGLTERRVCRQNIFN